MNNPLDYLIGSIIDQIVYVRDYVQIGTDKGRISFYNPLFLLVGDEKNEINITQPIPQIMEKTIEHIDDCDGEYINFILNDKTKIMVSLSEEDYSSPEAICAFLDNGNIIVN